VGLRIEIIGDEVELVAGETFVVADNPFIHHPGAVASIRRARLVEDALAVRLVTSDALELLAEASNEPR
jgi:hypothetical protein